MERKDWGGIKEIERRAQLDRRIFGYCCLEAVGARETARRDDALLILHQALAAEQAVVIKVIKVMD